jgi:tetratricopeptide (TPR) repeat protein
VRELPGVLAPLRPLSSTIPIIADLCELGIDRVTGREVGSRMLEASGRLLASTEISNVLRQGGSAVFVHIQAVEDARRGRIRSLELMDRMAAMPTVGDDMFLVLHGRWLGNAFRGRSAAAQPLRKQLDVITEDDVWRRKATLFVEAQLHALTGDLLSLTRVSEAIAELAAKFEGWRPWSAWTRAEIHRLRGELPAAEAELEQALAQAAPGEHRAWVLAAPAHAELRLLSGDAVGAASEAEMILRTVSALSLDLSAAIAAGRVRALALSSQGDHAAAHKSLEDAFELARGLDYDGLPLAVLYEAQAKLALAAGEQPEATAALARLHSMLEHADAPALVHRYEALRGESPPDLTLPSLRPGAPSSRTVFNESTALFTEVQTRMNTCNERDARAQQALDLLLEDSGASSGHLFLFDAGGLFPAVSHGQGHASETLLALAQEYLQADIGDSKTAAVTVADLASAGTTVPTVLVDGDSRLAPILLCDYASGRPMLSGLALLTVGTSLRMPRTDLIRAISRCLHAAGDSLAVAME